MVATGTEDDGRLEGQAFSEEMMQNWCSQAKW